MKASNEARRQARQLFRLCFTNGQLDEGRARQILEQLATSKPRNAFGTLAHFRRLVKEDQARHTAKIETARPLPGELRTQVESSLARTYGKGLKAEYSENKGLIGGMRIRVGSDVYDGSVQGRLATLDQRF